MRKLLTFALVLATATAALAQTTSYMQVDSANRLVVPNKSVWQDANGIAARDRDNVFTGANTFNTFPTLSLAGLSVAGRSANTTGAVAAITAGTDHFVLRRSGTAISFGLLVDANIDPAAAIAATKLSAGAQTSLARADLITRETTTAGAILSLPEGTDNGTHKVVFAAPAALGEDRTIAVPDANVTLANIAVSVGKINDLIAYLSDGLHIAGDLAIGGDADKFQTTEIAVYTIGGVMKTKATAGALTFTGTETVNNDEVATAMWGIWLVQIDAAGTISTKAAGADMTYTSGALAIAALPAPDAANVAMGYILIASPSGAKFTAGTTAMTGISTFVDGDIKALPTAIP
jgi:hypothetical protein